MSNCRHSYLSVVWIVEQYEVHSLNEHLANGRPWDMDRTYSVILFRQQRNQLFLSLK
jgi:ADP-glucose pyrophosphorylase